MCLKANEANPRKGQKHTHQSLSLRVLCLYRHIYTPFSQELRLTQTDSTFKRVQSQHDSIRLVTRNVSHPGERP
jgi:hypothetical protein